MSLSRHLGHQRQHRRLDRHDGFALLFEHVPARIDDHGLHDYFAQPRSPLIERGAL
jgi:hypothetical protein